MSLIKETPTFLRDKKKFINKNILEEEIIKSTLDDFIIDPKNKKFRLHKIKCKKDKNRFSITIPNTQYRILIQMYDNVTIALRLLNHDNYDRINKDC